MDQVYNFYNIEASFRNFLTAGNKPIQSVTIRNYISDLRHFLGWFVLTLKSKNLDFTTIDSDNLSDYLRREEIAQYKAYLYKNNIPVKTINRRLSTLRKFCTFCISQRWMGENPAKHVRNLSSKINNPTQEIEQDLMLEEFNNDLANDGVDHKEALGIINNIRELLSL